MSGAGQPIYISAKGTPPPADGPELLTGSRLGAELRFGTSRASTGLAGKIARHIESSEEYARRSRDSMAQAEAAQARAIAAIPVEVRKRSAECLDRLKVGVPDVLEYLALLSAGDDGVDALQLAWYRLRNTVDRYARFVGLEISEPDTPFPV